VGSYHPIIQSIERGKIRRPAAAKVRLKKNKTEVYPKTLRKGRTCNKKKKVSFSPGQKKMRGRSGRGPAIGRLHG